MKQERQPAVYILSSKRNGALYAGVTSQLLGRIYQHRTELFDGFAKENGVKRLVWYEAHDTMEQAILREKRIKAWKRQWRINLIEASNPDWRDLAVDLGFTPLAPLPVCRTTRTGDGFLPSQE